MTSKEKEKKKSKSCCIFYSMVPLVFILFILYISAYMGTMTASSEKIENFTISDVLQFPPQVHLINNLQSMAQKALLQKPNQFLEKAIVENPNQFIDPKMEEMDLEASGSSWPKRPERVLEPKNFELKRGPSLSFLDQGPTVMQTPKVPRTTPSSAQSWTTTQVPLKRWNSGATEGAFFASIADPSQAQLEADYMEERLEFNNDDFDVNDNNIYMDKIHGNGKIGSNMMLTPKSENFNLNDYDDFDDSFTRPKKSILGGTLPAFHQLVTFEPDQKSDKVGYAQIVHHDQIPSYQPPATQLSNSYGAPQASYDAPQATLSDSYGAPQPTYQASASSGYGSHSGDDHKPKGGYLAQRKPGPYGYPTPNFKCEYAKETLYVTKTDWTFDKKCFTVFRTKCRQEYEHGKGIGFEKECSEFTVTRCRTEYDTESETKCWTVFRKECFQVYVTKVDWEYEEKCETKTEEVCSGYGYDKHCEHVPKESCHQIPVKVEKQVPRTKCKKVPEKKCQDFPIFIPRKACKDFPKTVCVKDPINVPRKIPKKVCASIPKEVCNKIPVQVIKHVPKTVTKKVCTSTKPSGYHPYSDSASFHPPATYQAAGSSSNFHTSHSGLNHPGAALKSGSGSDANFNYFDGVEEVPTFNYE